MDVVLGNCIVYLKEYDKEKQKLRKEFQKNCEQFQKLKIVYKERFSSLIDLISSLENIVQEENDNESPAAVKAYKVPMFPKGTYIYVHNKELTIYTFSCEEMLAYNFEIKIQMIKIHVGNVVVGVSDKVLDEEKGYLGGG